MSSEYGDFSDLVREEQLRRRGATQAAAELQAQQRRAQAEAEAEKLAARQEENRRRVLLQREGAMVAAAAEGSVSPNVIQRRGLLSRRIGWIVGTRTFHRYQNTLEYDFTDRGPDQNATILLRDGQLKCVYPYAGPETSGNDHQRPLLTVGKDALVDPGQMLEEDFNEYRGYLAKFVVDNHLNIQ